MNKPIRMLFILAALTLPGLLPAASVPGMTADSAALPLSGTVDAGKPDCWVDHVQVQPAPSSGASGNENVTGAAAIGKLESSGHPGSEHRKIKKERSVACSKQLERRSAE